MRLCRPWRSFKFPRLGYDSGTNSMDETREKDAHNFCRSCGLCCTGHLFISAKLRPAELDPPRAGLTVFRSDPNQRGFSSPARYGRGECTIYDLASVSMSVAPTNASCLRCDCGDASLSGGLGIGQAGH
jgi:hypothetical protein